MSIPRPFFLLALLGAVVALAAGCGGSGSGSSSGDTTGSDLGSGIVATVGGTKITQAQLDALMKRAQEQAKAGKQTFPAVGSPEYKQIQDKAVTLLVQRAEYEQKAKQLGITITSKQIDQRLQKIINNPPPDGFGGDMKAYRAQLENLGLTEQNVRSEIIRPLLVSEALLNRAGGNLGVTDADVQNYYDLHSQQYSTPQTRVVRHILVKTKGEADSIYEKLKHGASFAALAKKYSLDPGTKNLGGQLTVTRNGQFVKPFEDEAFALRTGQISKPVHSTYGWHVIQAVKPATPRQVTPLAKVRTVIRQTLLQEKRTAAVNTFVASLTKEYCKGKLEFAKGFTPSPDPCASTK